MLAEVAGGEAANEAVDEKAARRLVAEAQTGERVAAHDQAPLLDQLAVLVNSGGNDVHVANLGPKAILVASLRSQLAWFWA